MARRRDFKAAVQPVNDLIQSYINNRMASDRQNASSAATFENEQAMQQMRNSAQKSQDELNFAQNMIPQINEGKLDPSSLTPMVQGLVGRYANLSTLPPTQAQRAASVVADTSKNSTLASIPTPEEFLQLLVKNNVDVTNPDVKGALDAFQTRYDFLKNNQARTPVNSYSPSLKTTVQQFMTPAEQGNAGQLQMAPTPEQLGANNTATALSGELSPEMTAGKVKAANATEIGTRPGAVARAGQIQGAQARAQYAAEFDPNIVQARVNQAIQLANVDLLKQGNSEKLKMTMEMGKSLGPLVGLMQKSSELSAKINTAAPSGLQSSYQRAGSALSAFARQNPDAEQLNGIAKSGGLMVATMIQGGRPSDTDAKATEIFWPVAGDSKETAQRKLVVLSDMIEVTPTVISMLPPTATFADRMAALNAVMAQRNAARGGQPAGAASQAPTAGAANYADPNWGKH